MFDALKQDMAQYYDRLGFTHENLTKDPACRKTVIEPVRQKIYQEMDDFYKKNPNLPAMLLKSRLHTVIARHFEPKLFPDMPFFFEMGMHCLGCPASRGESIEDACAVHGVDADELVEKINNFLKDSKN